MTGGDGAATETATCMACGRLLRDQESRRLRLGPVCRQRLQSLLASHSRRIGTPTAATHPAAAPAQLAAGQLEFWDDGPDEDDDLPRSRTITDVPTGALL